MRRRLFGCVWLLASALAALPAQAEPDPCSVGSDPGAPIRVGVGPAGLGALPEACPATDVGLSGSGQLLVATEDFYGWVEAGAAPRLRRQVSRSDWFTLWLPALTYRFSANATVEASASGLGPGSLGYHRALPSLRGLRVAPFVQLLLPTDFGYRYATRYALAHGFSVVYAVRSRLELLGGVSLPFYVVTGGTGSLGYFEPNAALDASFALAPWFSALAGLGLRVRSGHLGGVSALDPRVSLRFFMLRHLRVELAGSFPVAGEDRTDASAALNAAWLFERR